MVGSGGGAIDYNQLKDIIIEAIQDSGLSTAEISDISSDVSEIVDNTEDIIESVDELSDFLHDPSDMVPDNFASEITANNGSYNSGIDIPSGSNATSTITSIISSFSTAFNYDDSIDTLELPVPFVQNKYIVIHSDLISRHIEDTSLSALIHLVYTYIFCKWAIRFSKRIINWLECGEAFTESGFGKFLEYLRSENAVISASLM